MLSPVDAVRQIESGQRLTEGVIEGLGEAFFGRVVELLGTDPERAVALSRRWEEVLDHCSDPGFVYRAKGGGERAESKWAESAHSFLQAGEVAHDALDRLRFQVGAIDSLARSGDVDSAIRLGAQLAEGLNNGGDLVAAARAKLNLGNALVWADRYGEAVTHYREALELLPRSSVEGNAALLGIATSGLYSGSLAAVRECAEEAREFFVDEGFDSYVVQCDLTLAQVETLSGMPDSAIARLTSHLDSSLDQDSTARLHELLGDACLSANVHEQASVHYELARKAYGNPLGKAGCDLGLAHCLLAQGMLVEAETAFTGAFRGFDSVGNVPWALAALVGQSESRRRIGDIEGAQEALSRPLEELGDGFLRCLALIEDAEQRLLLGEPVQQTALEAAISDYASVPLGWHGHWIRARAERDNDSKLRAFRSMLTALLAARAMTRSTATSLAFLRDKDSALRSYLDLLVELDLPTELREVVVATRAAGVLDEVSAAKFGVDLDAYREERESDEGGDLPEGRRLGPKVGTNAKAGWGPLFATVLSRLQAEPAGDAAVFVEAGGHVWMSTPDHLIPTGIAIANLRNALKWLHFELSDPLGSDESLASHLDALRPLVKHLDRNQICPDSLTWQVPWALLGSREVELNLTPCDAPRPGSLSAHAKCLLVVGDCTNLPFSAEEVNLVKQQFLNTMVVDSLQSLHQVTGSFDLVHVVGHARQDPENPMFSTLLLSDGVITAAEVARLGLKTRFAVLSACETGRVDTVLPGEPGGLARGFIARGAQRIVANQWPVDDEAAFRFVSALYPCWVSGASLVDSVAVARIKCREWRNQAYYWGAPAVFCGVVEASS